MNEQNYASLPASKRLVEAGIVLETDFWWGMISNDQWTLQKGDATYSPSPFLVPAPSMVEVWRELPPCHNSVVFGSLPLIMCKTDQGTAVGYGVMLLMQTVNTNPTDALIDLLILARKEKV